MKRFLIIFLTFLIFTAIFSGCNESETSIDSDGSITTEEERVFSPSKHEVLLCTDMYTKYGYAAECNLKYEQRHAIQPETVRTIVFRGKEYSVICDDSSSNEIWPMYDYKDIESGNRFFLDEKGTMVGFFTDLPKVYETKVSLDECEAIARAFFSKYIDMSSFQLTHTYDSGTYDLFFYKYIEGIQTAEAIYVYMSYSGEIYAAKAFNIGMIPDDIKVDDINMDEVENSIYNKLAEIGKTIQAERGYDRMKYYINPNIELILLEDGRRAFRSVVAIDGQKGQPFYNTGGLFSVVVILDP